MFWRSRAEDDDLGDKIRLGKHEHEKRTQKQKKDDGNANEDRTSRTVGLAIRVLQQGQMDSLLCSVDKVAKAVSDRFDKTAKAVSDRFERPRKPFLIASIRPRRKRLVTRTRLRRKYLLKFLLPLSARSRKKEISFVLTRFRTR